MESLTRLSKLVCCIRQQSGYSRAIQWRNFVTSRDESVLVDVDYVVDKYIVHRRGDESYGSREYMLLPPGFTAEDANEDPSIKTAALLAHRNIMFGARASKPYAIQDVCLPLIEAAMEDISTVGNQAQAIAALNGLSDWVKAGLKKMDEGDEGDASSHRILQKMKRENLVSFEAVQAIATGLPRQGHSVVGIGTFRDGEEGWKTLARAYADLGLSDEVVLYQRRNAQPVGIEHLGDKNPDYIKSAGGALVRMFFL